MPTDIIIIEVLGCENQRGYLNRRGCLFRGLRASALLLAFEYSLVFEDSNLHLTLISIVASFSKIRS
jgi:hypothetical protein